MYIYSISGTEAVGERMEVTCRKAKPEDVDDLYNLIRGYAEKGIMLPRSKEALSRLIDDFYVAEADGRFVGCGSLCLLAPDLAEIRSLGIDEEYKGKGIGRILIRELVEEARRREIPKVMALTMEVPFFERNGFSVVPKEIFPEKVWTDCIHCPKRDRCDETAVLMRLG